MLGVVIKSCFAGADRGVREIGLEPPPQSAGARVKRDDHGGQNAAQELPSQDHCSSISDEMSMNRLTKPSAQMPPGNLASYDRDSGDAVPSLMRLPLYHAICPGNGLTGQPVPLNKRAKSPAAALIRRRIRHSVGFLTFRHHDHGVRR